MTPYNDDLIIAFFLGVFLQLENVDENYIIFLFDLRLKQIIYVSLYSLFLFDIWTLNTKSSMKISAWN